MRHAFSCVLGPETHKNARLRSSPPTSDKKEFVKLTDFCQNGVGKT